MSTLESTETPQVKSESSAAAEDLSRSIEQAMGKVAGERVRCVRVWGNFYRCNWWRSVGEDQTVGVVTNRIVASRFVRATSTPDGVKIDDVRQG